MSEFDGFEVMPHIDQRTNKGKIAARDKRIDQLEGEIGGTRTISIPSLALNYVDNSLESVGYGGELYVRQRALCENGECESHGTNWQNLFGTPERAARTMLDACDNCGQDECSGCQLYEFTSGGDLDYDALLEWLRGEGE